MSEIKPTDEDLKIMYGRSAKAAFTAAVAECFLKLAECPNGELLQEFALTVLKDSLKRLESPEAPHPMAPDDRIELRQYYRLFVAFYRDPNRLENLPSDVTKH